MVSKKQKKKQRAERAERAQPRKQTATERLKAAWNGGPEYQEDPFDRDGIATWVSLFVAVGLWYYGFLGAGFWGVLGVVGAFFGMMTLYAIIISPGHDAADRGPAKSEAGATKFVTWKQLEALGGRTAAGETLEVRVVGCTRFIRMVMDCKDRDGTVRRIAAY